MAEVIINDLNYAQFINPVVDGDTKICGTIPRNWALRPLGSMAYARPFDLPVIPENEWEPRLAARIAAKAQFSDLRNIGNFGQPIPSRDQDGVGYCFPAGTRVRMADGSQKPIEQVRLLDEVLTAEGNIRKVKQCHVREYEGQLACIKLWGRLRLRMTPNHEVLTKTGYIPAEKLTLQDQILERVESPIWRQISSLEYEFFKGPVYNIGVEGDNSYVAEALGVHNCWCHSGVSAHLVQRAFMNEPYVDLSPFAIGCMVKGFRDEGGWGSEGIEFQASKGCPISQFWPQQSMSRSNNNPETWINAALHKFADWRDLDPRNMKAQLISCLLAYGPCVVDYNWWSHSVCAVDLVSIRPFRVRIWNSWGDKWSENGMGILEENKALPDSAWVALVMTPSVN